MTAAILAQLAAHSAKLPATPRKPAGRPSVPLAAGASAVGRKKPRHLEDDLQAACVKWFRMQYGPLACLLFAIPNGGNRSPREGARLKAQGVTAGVPDLLLAVVGARRAGLFLELKVGRNKPSVAQEAHMVLLQLQGYAVAVVYSFDEFRAAIVNHIGY